MDGEISQGGKMNHPKYAMFFDMHTMQACPDVGHDFCAEEFAQNLKNAHVELVGFHAKCNQGFCYFDTKTGIRHPALPEGKDLFGEVVESCSRRGIRVSAYFNCGLSNEDGLCHPEWCRIGLNGNLLNPDIYDIGWVTPYMRTMCPNSPWRDYLFSLIREVKEKYKVAGFLFDSFNPFPCICPHCVKQMKKEGLDPINEKDVNLFAKKSVLRLAEDISNIIQAKENGFLSFFLGIGAQDNARIGSYLECECLPTNPAWGYDFLPLTSRFLRTLTKNPVFNMTGRFNTWGDFGSLRPQSAVEYDLFFGLANGMRPNIGDHLHPRGKLFKSVFERVEKIYSKIKKYDFWYENAVNLVDIGVLLPENRIEKSPALVGVTRMLSELRMQFDFITDESDFSKYKLLILPDDVLLTEKRIEKLSVFLAAGKKLFALGNSGLDVEKKKFSLEKEFGIKFLKECEYDPAYFALSEEYAENLPDIPLAAYTKGNIVKALEGTQTAGVIVAPYYNKHWDGIYSFFYTPPDKKTEIPFLTFHENTAYCAYPLCSSYYEQASPDLRKVFEIVLEKLLPAPLLKTGRSFPSFGRAFVTEIPEGRNVHLLNYLPELRGKSLLVEEELTANDMEITLRLDGKKVKRVYLAPEKKELAFSISDDKIKFTIPHVKGYCMAVVEMEK